MRDLNEKAWKQVIQLGRCPNVWLTTEPIGGSDLDCLRIVYEEIGSDKLIWGTDYPWWSKLYNYNVLISVMKQCDFLSEKEKKDIMGENALRVFEFKS
jgi:predicted TIM-barrel fold metal-dependent hydrolase